MICPKDELRIRELMKPSSTMANRTNTTAPIKNGILSALYFFRSTRNRTSGMAMPARAPVP